MSPSALPPATAVPHPRPCYRADDDARTVGISYDDVHYAFAHALIFRRSRIGDTGNKGSRDPIERRRWPYLVSGLRCGRILRHEIPQQTEDVSKTRANDRGIGRSYELMCNKRYGLARFFSDIDRESKSIYWLITPVYHHLLFVVMYLSGKASFIQLYTKRTDEQSEGMRRKEESHLNETNLATNDKQKYIGS